MLHFNPSKQMESDKFYQIPGGRQELFISQLKNFQEGMFHLGTGVQENFEYIEKRFPAYLPKIEGDKLQMEATRHLMSLRGNELLVRKLVDKVQKDFRKLATYLEGGKNNIQGIAVQILGGFPDETDTEPETEGVSTPVSPVLQDMPDLGELEEMLVVKKRKLDPRKAGKRS